jgi:hypothetical protein
VDDSSPSSSASCRPPTGLPRSEDRRVLPTLLCDLVGVDFQRLNIPNAKTSTEATVRILIARDPRP